MIAAISPADINFEETLSTLRYERVHCLHVHVKASSSVLSLISSLLDVDQCFQSPWVLVYSSAFQRVIWQVCRFGNLTTVGKRIG